VQYLAFLYPYRAKLFGEYVQTQMRKEYINLKEGYAHFVVRPQMISDFKAAVLVNNSEAQTGALASVIT
jgi:hypothetical protein